MKKTVRIRKAKAGEKPGYINKTKKFLQKAQTGMSVQESGAQQQRMQQMYMAAYSSLMNDSPADVVYYNLINDYGVDGQTANIILQSAFNQLVQEGYINPEVAENQGQGQEQEEDQDPAGDASQLEGSDNQAEEEEVMMSEEDTSHIDNYAMEDNFDEEQMQQEAFKKGGSFEPHYMYNPETGEPVEARTEAKHLELKQMGYLHADEMEQQSFQKGGYYFPMMNQGGANPHPTLDQYDRAGQAAQPNFSLDQLIQQQAGVQLNNPQGSQISDYIANYQPIGNSYQGQNWLSQSAKKGGSVELPKARMGVPGIPQIKPPEPPKVPTETWAPWKQGYDWYNQIAPFQNVSGLGKTLPIFTGLGYGLHKTPGLNWMLGMKGGPKQESYLTKNVSELSSVLQGNEASSGVFSKNVSAPNELSVDQMVFATEDLAELLRVGNQEGRSSFTLGEAIPGGQGTIGGIYPAESKISMGEDDAGNKFFDISYTYKPGYQGSYFSVPSDATKTSFRNRFYYKPDSEKGFQVFDQVGNALESGTNNLFQVTRPLVPSLYRSLTNGIFNQPGNTLGTSGIMGLRTGPGIKTSGPLKGLISRDEITSLPPTSFNELSTKGKIGRGLEQIGFQYGTFPFGLISSGLGYNPIRTQAKNITDISEPATIYSNPAKPGLGSPLNDVNTAEDILNNTNYFRRKGLNTALGLGLTGILGYNAYDAMFGEQDPPPLGPKRNLLPRDTKTFPMNEQYQINIPDSLKNMNLPFLNEQNYYRNQNNYEMPNWDTIPENYRKEGGKISKRKFTKKLLSFYNEGGENELGDPNTIGRGNRMDTGTRQVENIKSGFVKNLKDSSNKSTTEEIYDLAQSNPQIMQTLMQDGMKENLAEESSQPMPEAKWGRSMDDVPEWYSGYKNNMPTPREYKRMYKQLKKMMPKGLDISRAGYASSFGGYPNHTLSAPGYMSMFSDFSRNNYLPFMGGYGSYMGGFNPYPYMGSYGGGYQTPNQIVDSWTSRRPSAQSQANEVEVINNTKGVIQSLKNTNIVDGDSDIEDYSNFFNQIKMQQGGYVNMQSENPLSKFISGGMESDYYEPYMERADNGITVVNQDMEARGMPKMLNYDEWKADQLAQGDPNPDTSMVGYRSYIDFYTGAVKDTMGVKGSASSSQGNQGQSNQNQGCPAGHMWSTTRQACVPMMQYRPHYRQGPSSAGGFFGALTPWNPAFRRAGNWTQQMSLPYNIGTGEAYTGQLSGNPDARIVTKSKGLFKKNRRPSKWIDIYNTSGDGLSAEDIASLQNQYDPSARRQNQRQEKRDQNQAQREQRRARPSKTDLIDQELMKDSWTKDHWDDLSKRDKRHARRTFAFENEEYRRPSDKFVFGAQGTKFKESKRTRKQKMFGGYIPEAMDGMVTGAPFNMSGPMNTGMNQTTEEYDPYSNLITEPGKLTNELVMNQSNPKTNFNQIANQQPIAGEEEDPCANATAAEKMDPNSPCHDPKLVGVNQENRSMWEMGGEEFLNQKNMFANTFSGLVNRAQNAPNNRNLLLDISATEKNAPTTSVQKRGNWGATTGQGSGMFRYDQEGQNASGMSPDVTKFGGFMQQGGANVPYFDEGQEVFMSEEDLRDYLAAGGQVEYLY